MHELGITQNIVRIVQEEAARAGASRISKVKLRVGEMTGIVDASLQLCFEFCVRGTVAEGASLEIERIPLRARCSECAEDFAVEGFRLVCPTCSGRQVEITAGRELQVQELEVEEE